MEAIGGSGKTIGVGFANGIGQGVASLDALGSAMDTAESSAQSLGDSAKNAQERLEAVGAAGQTIGDSIASGIGQGVASLDALGSAMDTAESSAQSLGDSAKNAQERLEAVGAAGQTIGNSIASGIGQGASSLDTLGSALDDAENAAHTLGDAGMDAGKRIVSGLEDAANAADRLSTSFAKSFIAAQNAGQSFGSSIKTGISGAVDSAIKKVSGFVSDTVGNAKKIGNAFLHPVSTIKGAFVNAMTNAAKGVDGVGDEAQKSENQLEQMGNAGNEAGGKLQSGLEGALKVVGALAAAAVAVTGIAQFTSAALNASQAAEGIQYSFDQTFGDGAADVSAWAGNFADAVHRSESEVKSFLTSNKQLYEGMGVTGEAASDLSRMTTSLAYDIGNKFGVEDTEALAGLQDAISGNADALNAYGVQLDEAALKSTAMSMGLGSNLEELDEATLAQVRFNSILEQTSGLQGEATRSLGGFAGGVKALKATWTEFLEKAGDKLAPAFDTLFGVILDSWPSIEPALLGLVDLLASGFENAAPIIGDFAQNLLPELLGMVGELAPIFSNIGGELLPVFATVLGTVVEAAGPLMPLFETLTGTLLPPLADLFGTLVSTLLPPAAELLGALAPVLDALSPVLEVVAGAIGLVADKLADLISWLAQGIEKAGEFAQSIKDSAVGQFVSGIGEKLGNFVAGNARGTDNFEGGWTRVHEAGDEMIQAKHSGGLAYLPRGSAVIPASKTEEILSQEGPVGGNVINITNLLPQSNDPVPAHAVPAQDPIAPVIQMELPAQIQDPVTPVIQLEAPVPAQNPVSDGLMRSEPAVPQDAITPVIQLETPAPAQDPAEGSLMRSGPAVPQDAITPVIQLETPAPAQDPAEGSLMRSEPADPQPAPRWIPTLMEGNPSLQEKREQDEPDDTSSPEPPSDHRGSGDSTPPSPSNPEPFPVPTGQDEPSTRRVIHELHITISSPDQTLSQEMLEQIMEQMRPVVEEIFDEKTDENWSDQAMQNGYVAG